MRDWRAVVGIALTGVLAVAGAVAGGPVTPGAGASRPRSLARPSPVPAALDAVSCPDADECVAVGGAGGVRRSVTGGRTWSTVRVPTTHYLYGVSCPSVGRCVAVGDAGTVLVSRDGGRRWVTGHSGDGLPLSSVSCPSVRRCVAVGDGDTVLASADGGRRWHRRYATGLGTATGVACGAPTTCSAVTSTAVENLATTGAAGWAPVTVPFAPLDALSAMSGVGCAGATCVAVGQRGLLAQSIDGGAAWSVGAPDTSSDLQGVACPAPGVCVVVGDQGTVLRTVDGGVTWATEPVATPQTLLGVSCAGPTTCVAVGSGGTVLTSVDGGVSWVRRAGRTTVGAPLRVLVVGDSFAHTVAVGLARNAAAYGVTLLDGSTDGCDLARGSPVLVNGQPVPVTGPCAATGPGWPAQYQSDVATDHPTLTLLVLGPWDLTTRMVDGQWWAPGQPAYDAYYEQQVAAALTLLTAGGGRVVLATVPAVLDLEPDRCRPLPATVGRCPNENQRRAALDAAARQAAAGVGPRVQVVDLGGRLSPGGHYADVIDHVVVRASDGVHLSEPGGEWLTPWLLPRLVAAAEGPDPAGAPSSPG